MLKLLKIEWLKIIPNRTIWLFLGIYLITLPGIMTYMVRFAKRASEISRTDLSYLSFPEVWTTVAYLASYFHFLLGLIVIYLITREFQHKTLRQQVMDGLSRFQLLLAKVSIMLALSCLAVVGVIATAFVTGFMYSEQGIPSNVYQNFSVFGNFGLQALCNMSLAAALAFLIRKTGLCFILFLFFPLFEKLAGWATADQLSLYTPKAVFGALIPLPLQEIAANIGWEIARISPSTAVALSVSYLLVFLGICWFSLEKSNL